MLERSLLWFIIRLKYGFHLKNPIYPFRVLKNILKAKYYNMVGGNKFVLRGIDFAVTYACNFRCEHCYAEKLKQKNTPLMTIDDYERVCGEAMKLGCLCFSLQGGEVFVRKDWEKIIQAFQPKKNHLLLTTNGSMLDEKKVKRLKELNVDTIYFSIDSGIAEEHDLFRNHKGSFEKIMQAIDLCKIYKHKIVINICVGKFNLYSKGFKALLDYSHKNSILVETIFARSLGNFEENDEIMLEEKDRDYYYKLRKDYPYVVRDLDNNYGAWGCPAVKEVLYISAYGDVCPCPYSHVSMGNIKQQSLREIRERGLQSKWYNQFHEECLTAVNKDFMRIYYPLISKEPLITIDDLDNAENSENL